MNTPDWNVRYFDNNFCSGNITFLDNTGEPRVKITGTIRENLVPRGTKLLYWAANPAQRGISPGSGYPYANAEQAFDRTPNMGYVSLDNNNFEITIIYPSGYYAGLGSVLIDPTLHIKLDGYDEYFASIRLGEPYPYRTLTYPSNASRNARDSPMFYHQKLPIRSQESILRASAYPCEFHTPSNFWGLKPAN